MINSSNLSLEFLLNMAVLFSPLSLERLLKLLVSSFKASNIGLMPACDNMLLVPARAKFLGARITLETELAILSFVSLAAPKAYPVAAIPVALMPFPVALATVPVALTMPFPVALKTVPNNDPIPTRIILLLALLFVVPTFQRIYHAHKDTYFLSLLMSIYDSELM